MREILESAGTLVGAIIVAVITQVTPPLVKYIKSKINKGKKGEEFKRNLTVREKINEALVELRILSNANRVYILEYHNGDVSLSGLPFNYSSMTYENTDVSTKNMITEFQKVPISPVANFLVSLDNTLEGYSSIQENNTNSLLSQHMNYYGVATTYTFKISNHIKDGVIGLDWVNEEGVTLTENQIKDIKTVVLRIKNLLSTITKY
jgi:hypothetical protein